MVWLDTQDSSNRDRNPADLRQLDILSQSHRHSLYYRRNFFMRNFLHTRYRLPVVLNSWEELLRFTLCGSRQIIHKSAQLTEGGLYILSSTDRLFRCITTLQYG